MATVGTTTTQTFSDVTSSYWANNVISILNKMGYITGYPDGSFNPDGAITRAEFVSVLSKTLKLQAYDPAASGFRDVSRRDWFYGSVESAVNAGVAQGDGRRVFSPNKPVTREEMAVILVNALGKQDEANADMDAQTTFVDDASIDSWARGSVVVATKYDLLKGYPDNSFRPGSDASRTDACAMISSFLGVLQ